jgi:PAS domain S-box-containing protein
MFSKVIKRATLGLLGLVSLMMLIWPASAPAQAQPKILPAASAKGVLLLYTYGDGLPAYQKATPAFLTVMTAGGINTNDLFFEYLDLQRNDSAEYRQRLADLLRYKYTKHRVGLIVTVHTAALHFLLDEGKGLFPDAPVFAYLHVRPELTETKNAGRRILQRPQRLDIAGTLEIALKMFPQTRKIVFVTGTATGDRNLEHEARRAFEAWRDKLEFQYTNDRSVEEILQLVASLPHRSIIIYSNVFSDKTGQTFIPREVGERVARAANVPVFCLWDTLMGSGVIGGSLLSFEAEGTCAANVALDILNGKVLLRRPVTTLSAGKTFMFDWQQLKRWGVNESIIPRGSVLVNRIPTLWEQYKGLVILGIAVFLAQTFLVVGLLVQRSLKKKAESSVRQKTEELDQFFNVSLDLLGIADAEGYFLRLNPAAETILGYTCEELMAKRFLEFVHPDDLDRTREAVSTLASQQKVFSFENLYRCKDGTYRWLQWSSAPAGNLIYAAARDITERKRTEEILREREEAAREMAREASVLAEIGRTVSSTLNIDQIYEAFAAEAQKIITFDRIVISIFDVENGTFKNVYMAGREVQDRATENVHPLEGSGNAEMLRTKSTVLVQTEDFREYQDRFPMLFSTFEAGFRSIMNVPLSSKGEIIGGLLLRSLKPNAYTDKDVRVAESIGNQIAGAIAIAQIFLKQKQAEEALRKSEERFRQVAETVGDFIWEVDADGLYRYTSPSVEKILGYTPGELIGKKHFYDLFAPEVREELKTTAFTVFAAKQAFRDFPNPNISKEEKLVHLETSGVPMLDENGNLVGYRGADTDVTERRRAEEELRRHQEHLEELVWERTVELATARDEAEGANRAKSTFLANMSHELRTPLNSILGIAQLMERDAGFPLQHRDTLKILSRSGAYLLELINDVLEMSKIEAGKTTLDATSFDPRSFLGDLEEVTRLRADQKGLKLFFEYQSPLPQYVETDVRKLRQILINLLGNAIKYTERGRVTLRVTFKEGRDTPPAAKAGSGACLEFEIEDTGIGIAPEDRQRIFEPFVQVNPGQAAREGTGLGLTLSRMFVEQLGGEITIRSQVGRGSTFVFDIPVKRAEGITIHTEKAVRQVLGLMPGQPYYRLLVVDDSVENRFTLRRLLEQCGFIVLEASGGQEAVDLFGSGQPHLIWMDLRMPGMDGYEAARRIREAERGRRNGEGKEAHTLVIALTAGIMENKASSPLAGVFDDWVYKPFREAEIFDKLEKHLGVQFIYQPSVELVAADKDRGKGVTPAELAVLPAAWLREFLQVLRRGWSSQLIDLIHGISPEHADLAGTLAELVHVYRFDHLIVATEGALQEASDG